MPILVAASRRILKATYSPLVLGDDQRRSLSNAAARRALAYGLDLHDGEIDALLQHLEQRDSPEMLTRGHIVATEEWPDLLKAVLLLRTWEPNRVALKAPDAAALVALPAEDLRLAAEVILDYRIHRIVTSGTFDGAGITADGSSTGPGAGGSGEPTTVRIGSSETDIHSDLIHSVGEGLAEGLGAWWAELAQGLMHFFVPFLPFLGPSLGYGLSAPVADRVRATAAAIDAFTAQMKIVPIGWLHLERLEMTPVGMERGELVGTIPLAPKETVSVVEKEWTVVTEEFESIVTDVLEEFSETGVTEKSDLAQSTESQTEHSRRLNFTASAKGSYYGFVTFTAGSEYNTETTATNSAQESRNHAVEVTRKASTRTRKEHKVTIKTTSVKGREEETTRTITNPSEDQAMRVDYFSMMRRWRTRLYRYGLRMTYDLAIPEPGGTLRRQLVELAAVEAQLGKPFQFPVEVGHITRESFERLVSRYGATVRPPPAESQSGPRRELVGGHVEGLGDMEAWQFREIPVRVPDGYRISGVKLDAHIGSVNYTRWFDVYGIEGPPWDSPLPQGPDHSRIVKDLSDYKGFLIGRTGEQKIIFRLHRVNAASVVFDLTMTPIIDPFQKWQVEAWQALRQAAYDRHLETQQWLSHRRNELTAQLAATDTLTLRRQEREEIMKGVLRWLFGPDFHFIPREIIELFTAGTTSGETEHQESAGHGRAFGGPSLRAHGIGPARWQQMIRFQERVKFIHQAIEWENILYFLYPYFWDNPNQWDLIRQLDHPDPTRREFVRAGSARVVLTIRPGYEEPFAAFIEAGGDWDELLPEHPYRKIADEIRDFNNSNYPGIPPANPEASPEEIEAEVDNREKGVLIGEWYEYTPTSGIDIALTSSMPDLA